MLLPVPTDQQQPTASTRQYTRSPTSELSTLSLIVVACLPDQRHLLQPSLRTKRTVDTTTPTVTNRHPDIVVARLPVQQQSPCFPPKASTRQAPRFLTSELPTRDTVPDNVPDTVPDTVPDKAKPPQDRHNNDTPNKTTSSRPDKSPTTIDTNHQQHRALNRHSHCPPPRQTDTTTQTRTNRHSNRHPQL